MESADFVQHFGRYVDARSATLFVGAGLSRALGYPDWPTLLESSRERLGIDPISDLPQLVQYYVNESKDGRSQLVEQIEATFAAVGEPPLTPAHSLLEQLPVDEFWTTNYDSLLERSITDARVYKRDSDLAKLASPERRRIYKMHGSIDLAKDIVITRDDYERYPSTHARFWHLLRAQFLTKTFLFLGFGFTDPNLELVFKLVRLATNDSKREHFAIMKRPDPVRSRTQNARSQRLFELQMSELENVNVHVVTIDRFEEIDAILARLVARCRPPQLMVSASAPGDVARTGTGAAYPTGEIGSDLREIAKLIGLRLVPTSIPVVTGSDLGSTVGYTIMRELMKSGASDDSRFTLVRRESDRELDSPNLRLGRIIFTGHKPTDLRSAALEDVRALLVIGGGTGVQAEVDQAARRGLGVVPVGASGGTAQIVWRRMRDDIANQRLGGKPIDVALFDQLVSTSARRAATAAVRLVTRAMYLS